MERAHKRLKRLIPTQGTRRESIECIGKSPIEAFMGQMGHGGHNETRERRGISMAKKPTFKLSVETLKHGDVSRKNIPAAERGAGGVGAGRKGDFERIGLFATTFAPGRRHGVSNPPAPPDPLVNYAG
ncbi:MAG: hypothetical protein A2V90_02130 [Gammaproteobacteria bacterium RBG_16_57_12]|nr:MAG: hypothetical protein A2V90_02130 [Gammaproteobacteria bacterium RBG_16_57_12]